tara:strand:- start:144 stop:332 length:189 start_codon:yes stop_codon:yes gene_type:complete
LSHHIIEILGVIFLSFSTNFAKPSAPSHQAIVEKMPKSSTIEYHNEITYIKAPTPWSKTLNK